MPLEQFASCISGLNNNRSYLTSDISKYLKERNLFHFFSYLVVKVFDHIGTSVYSKANAEDGFYPYDSCLDKPGCLLIVLSY